MSIATIDGNIVFPSAPGGANQTIIIGAPSITDVSATGPQLTYTEGSSKTLLVKQADGVVTVSFDTVAAADLVYVGTDQPIDIKLDGSVTAISLVADGFILLSKSAAVSMTVEAKSSNDATVLIALLGA